MALNARTLEEKKIASAIKTDFILSAEIMAITLAAIPESGILNQAVVLAIVGIGITVAVYGVVALTVKADDAGVALAQNQKSLGDGPCQSRLGARARCQHASLPDVSERNRNGSHDLGWRRHYCAWSRRVRLPSIGRLIHAIAEAAAHALPPVAGAVEWIVTAAGSGIVGLLIGAALIPVIEFVFAPAWRFLKRLIRRD